MDSAWIRELKKVKIAVAIAISVVAIGCGIGIYESRKAGEDAGEAVDKARTAFHAFVVESRNRRDEACTISEREHLQDVDKLRRTYSYLDALTPIEVSQTINQFIIANLNEQEENARRDVAPSYCDEQGIGLPEPDPTLPKRRDYSILLIVK